MSDYENDGDYFDVWSYVARLGCRIRPSSDPFFADGDAVCQMRTCQYLIQEDDEELLHTDFEEFSCQVPGCNATFNQLLDSEFHYASKHTFACSVCQKSLPSSHLLGLHISENHDSFFDVLSKKRPSYECLLETCANANSGGPKFWTAEERKQHCIEDHKFSSDFKFNDYKKIVNKKTEKKKSKVQHTSNSNSNKFIPNASQVSEVITGSVLLMETDESNKELDNQNTVSGPKTNCQNQSKISSLVSTTSCGVQSANTHASKKSLDPALDKKYSSSVYSKQMSLDESNTNDNFTTATKRSPVSLAMMGERLSNQNMLAKNRHSVCLGAGFNAHEPPPESNVNRRSLSPSSELKANAQDHIQKEHKVHQPNQLSKRGTDTDEVHTDIGYNNHISQNSPQKRRNSRSSIPIYIGKAPTVNQSPESPKSTRNRHSMSYKSSNEAKKATEYNQQIRSRRSTFPRNSFSSMTSNSSSTSATNDSYVEDRYFKRSIEAVSAKSPSHKQYNSPYKTLGRTSFSTPSNNNPKAFNVNNNIEQDLNSTVQIVPVSPSAKSRIPVLRSSSCRAVPQSVNNAKSTIPRSICFGHGIPKAFNSSFKGGQNWYQMLTNKSENKLRSYSTEKYVGQGDMDTSGIEKCNFNDMRMALD